MPENLSSARQTVPPIALRRRITDHFMTGVAAVMVILVLVPLFAIFAYLVYRGIGSLNWSFITQTPKPVGEAGGGMASLRELADFGNTIKSGEDESES